MKERDLDKYLMEIGRAELLDIDEERELLKVIQEKGTDCEEMKQLEKSYARFVVSLLRQYQNKGLSIWELIEVGTEALRKAAMTYEFDPGLKFIAYAVSLMRPAMIQAIEEKKWLNDGTDSERNPAVKRLREEGYVLVDANAFGIDGEITGEFWVFSRNL